MYRNIYIHTQYIPYIIQILSDHIFSFDLQITIILVIKFNSFT